MSRGVRARLAVWSAAAAIGVGLSPLSFSRAMPIIILVSVVGAIVVLYLDGEL